MYNTVYLDPPWKESGGGKIKRGADKHYPLMKTDEIYHTIKTEILPLLNNDCHLYLWTTNNFLKDGLLLIEQLGFRYITCITWTKNQMGLGQYFRGKSEHCLFAVRGRHPYKIKDGKRQQGVTSFYAKKSIHSRKPEEMREMIEKVSYPPYLEVFARKQTPKWSVWGNEVNNLNLKQEESNGIKNGKHNSDKQ